MLKAIKNIFSHRLFYVGLFIPTTFIALEKKFYVIGAVFAILSVLGLVFEYRAFKKKSVESVKS